MPDSSDIDTLWLRWEQSVLNFGFESEQTEKLCHTIELLESDTGHTDHEVDDPLLHGPMKAHRLFDQLYLKKMKHIDHVNHAQPGKRIIRTRFGAIYEHGISVRGLERLMKHQKVCSGVVKLKEGFFHVNHLPGVQPNASEQVNARNKNVEKVRLDVVEQFIDACKSTGMAKRGWKKAVNEQFDISRQEFTKWLMRYFPCYGMPVPIERKHS